MLTGLIGGTGDRSEQAGAAAADAALRASGHDPLCGGFRANHMDYCDCDLIAVVRGDEREKCVDIVRDAQIDGDVTGWNTAIDVAVEYLRGES